MEELLIRLLNQTTGLPVYNLKKPEETDNCIVYSYSESVFSYSDNKEDCIKYTVYLSLHIKSDLNKYKKLLKNVLNENGFYKITIPPANIGDTGLLIQKLICSYIEQA